MADYYSCEHVSPELISQEVKRVRELSAARKSKLYSSYHCISCEFACTFDRISFRKHATESQHVVFVRNKEPLELYCAACQDFQFSSVFDKMTKRKRPRTGLTLSSTGKVSPVGAVYRQTKGLCNMGATCFMSSVLQVLMKNTVLMNCDQLQLPYERCRTVVDRSMSIDNSSRLSGDSSGNSAATANANAHCIFCEFKKLSSEANRLGSLSSLIFTVVTVISTFILCFRRDNGSDSLVPAHLLYAVWSELDYIAGYQQQDAHEFLIAFLDGMDQHLRLNHPFGASDGVVQSLSVPPPPYSSNSPRKSPRTESKGRAFSYSVLSPPMLRRGVSDNEPSSTGSAHYTAPCAEMLEVCW
jgi:hypothetical protein